MSSNEKCQNRPRAFFGRRRHHKLRQRQSDLLSTLLPSLTIDLSAPAPESLRTLFPMTLEAVALEIGFGGGEHIVSQAQTNPKVGFIGCEAFANGMAKALSLLDAHSVQNVRLHHGDALDLLNWLPEGSLSRIDVLFPDPWPKRRHWKRRLISDAMVGRFASALEKKGTLRFATDIADYAEWSLLRILRSAAFEWTAERANDWREPWADFSGTRYQMKAERDGRTPCYLVFRRS